MSCTEVKVVDKHGEVLTEEEIQNSNGIPLVWEALYQKYCENPERYFMSDRNREVRLKKAAEKATDGERACLKWTRDYVWVARENIPKLCEYIEQFANEHIPSKYVQTFRSTGKVLKKIYDKYPECLGACMMGTDTCEDIWYPEDAELGEYFPYHFGTGNRHWEIFGDDHLAEGIPAPPPSEELIEARQRKFVEAALALFGDHIVANPEVLEGKPSLIGEEMEGRGWTVTEFFKDLADTQALHVGEDVCFRLLGDLAKAFDTYPEKW